MNWPHLPFQPRWAQGVRQFVFLTCLPWLMLPSLGDYSLSPAFFLFTDSFFSSRAYLTLALLGTPLSYVPMKSHLCMPLSLKGCSDISGRTGFMTLTLITIQEMETWRREADSCNPFRDVSSGGVSRGCRNALPCSSRVSGSPLSSSGPQALYGVQELGLGLCHSHLDWAN